MKTAFVYIMGSSSGTIYVGVTSNLERRVWEHKHHVYEGFTKRHNVTKLLCMEEFSLMDDAIAREKQVKAWLRDKKLALIRDKIRVGTIWRGTGMARSTVPDGVLDVPWPRVRLRRMRFAQGFLASSK